MGIGSCSHLERILHCLQQVLRYPAFLSTVALPCRQGNLTQLEASNARASGRQRHCGSRSDRCTRLALDVLPLLFAEPSQNNAVSSCNRTCFSQSVFLPGKTTRKCLMMTCAPSFFCKELIPACGIGQMLPSTIEEALGQHVETRFRQPHPETRRNLVTLSLLNCCSGFRVQGYRLKKKEAVASGVHLVHQHRHEA